MKVKYLGPTRLLTLINGKTYDVMAIEKEWFRIVDESEEDYLYPPEYFEIVEGPILKDLYENEQA